MSEDKDKRVKPDQIVQRGFVSDVAVPIGEAIATDGVGGAVNALAIRPLRTETEPERNPARPPGRRGGLRRVAGFEQDG